MDAPRRHSLILGLLASLCYSFAYFWRQPMFLVPSFETMTLGGIPLQSWMALSQTIGYGLAKAPGAILVSQIKPSSRLKLLWALLVGGALFSSVAVAYGSPIVVVLMVFLSALPASLVFTLLLQFGEGRVGTDVIGGMMNLATVLSSAASRTAASSLMKKSSALPSRVVPLLLGGCALAPALVVAWFVSRVPPPSAEESASRSKRRPMSAAERRAFFRTYFVGIVCITLAYGALTAYRSFRDFFAKELYDALHGGSVDPSLYFLCDLPGAVISSLSLMAITRVSSNRKAVYWMHAIAIASCGLMGAAALLLSCNAISGTAFMVLVGIAIYSSYAPISTTFYDRVFGATKTEGTMTPFIFMSDAAGYVGSISILCAKTFGSGEKIPFVSFFLAFSYALAIGMAILFVLSLFFYRRKLERGSRNESGNVPLLIE